MRLLPLFTAGLIATAALGTLAAPAAAAAVVDISVERSLSTPTDEFDVSSTRPVDADISLVNRGDAPQDADFSFTVPAGWTVTPAFSLPADETCDRSGSVYSCTITAIEPGIARSTQLLLTAAPATPVGGVTVVAVTGGPVGAVDANPGNNATQFRFRNVGTSDVVAATTQSATTAAPGGTVDFAVTLTNRGPDPTVGGSAFVHVLTSTADAVTVLVPTGPGEIVQGGDADAPIAGPSFSWAIDLAAGASATLHVSWRANVLGAEATLELLADHTPDARSLADLTVARSQPVLITNAVLSTPTPVPTSTPPPTATPAGPELAATGVAHPVRAGLLGWCLVVAGAALVFAGRRRRTTRVAGAGAAHH